MYQIKILSTARNDMENIIFYIKYHLKNINGANKLIEIIKKNLEIIKLFPYGCSSYENTEYRSANFNNYMLFYKVDEISKTIYIIKMVYKGYNINGIINN